MSLHSQIDSHKIREGFIYKKGNKINKSFQRRYFVLYDDRTCDYFKDKNQSNQRNKARGTIHLTQIKRVELVAFDDPNDINNAENSDNHNQTKAVPQSADSQDAKNKSKKINSLNGWCTMNNNNNNNNIVSSVQPPPDYNNVIDETEKLFEKERVLLCESLLALKSKHNDQQQICVRPPVIKKRTHSVYRNNSNSAISVPRTRTRTTSGTNAYGNFQSMNIIVPHHSIYQSSISPAASGAECELTDDDIDTYPNSPIVYNNKRHRQSSNFSNTSSNLSYINKQIISGDIANYHSDSASLTCTPRDEYDAFQIILNDTKLGLKSERRYSFALIGNDREWILSVDTNEDLKDWICLFSKLSQGKQIFDGHLNKNKYFVLYQNKVLNCYKNKGKEVEFDIDLRHVLYLKYATNTIEIASNANCNGKNNKKNNNNLILTALNNEIAMNWFSKINSVFSDKYLVSIIYDSVCKNIHIYHNGQDLKCRYIAMYRDYIVIFKDKKQLNNIKTLTFFDKNIFRDYIRKEKCTLIPLNKNIKCRRASRNHGKYTFVISNAEGDRKWYFSLNSKRILADWLKLLTFTLNKNRKCMEITNKNTQCHNKYYYPQKSKNKNYCDVEIESTLNAISTKSSKYVWPTSDKTKDNQIAKYLRPQIIKFISSPTNVIDAADSDSSLLTLTASASASSNISVLSTHCNQLPDEGENANFADTDDSFNVYIT